MPTLPTQTYADAATVIEQNPAGWFVVETFDDGVTWAGHRWTRRCFNELAPGESFTIHSVHETRREAQVAAREIREDSET